MQMFYEEVFAEYQKKSCKAVAPKSKKLNNLCRQWFGLMDEATEIFILGDTLHEYRGKILEFVRRRMNGRIIQLLFVSYLNYFSELA
jgi:hypothetical protein